jgi:hypothetical protein
MLVFIKQVLHLLYDIVDQGFVARDDKNAGHRGKIPERARRHRNKRKPKGSAIGCGRNDRKGGGKAAAAVAGDLLDLRLARGLVGELKFAQNIPPGVDRPNLTRHMLQWPVHRGATTCC